MRLFPLLSLLDNRKENRNNWSSLCAQVNYDLAGVFGHITCALVIARKNQQKRNTRWVPKLSNRNTGSHVLTCECGRDRIEVPKRLSSGVTGRHCTDQCIFEVSRRFNRFSALIIKFSNLTSLHCLLTCYKNIPLLRIYQ